MKVLSMRTREHNSQAHSKANSSGDSDGGFTLIEVLASVAILALLLTAVLAAIQSVQKGTLATTQYDHALGYATEIAESLRETYGTSAVDQVKNTIPVRLVGNELTNSSTSSPIVFNIQLTADAGQSVGTATSSGQIGSTGYTYDVTYTASGAQGSQLTRNFTITVTDPDGRKATVQAPAYQLS
ncbi:prepilin-type N-terminal cleavage/methylation domain-containing protein [Alicyclobacillus acidoterrestris]|uniref:prepilin-type N-terminal cleavage/methylation domain-containing protein n=1 Tax=Alicyclobacillus acidoterrestris TaxID=1450 RepID=UPI003F538A40